MSFLTKKPTKATKTTAVKRPGAVAPLTPTAPGAVASGLDASLPELTAVDALNPGATAPPTAVLENEEKKPFSETAVGKFFSSEGGLAGVAASVGTVIAALKGTPTEEVLTEEQRAAAAAAEEEPKVLGLPPFAFAAVLVLLLIGLVVVVRKTNGSS